MEQTEPTQVSTIKKRRPNWSKDECLLLAELVNAKKNVVEGKFGPSVTSAKRQEAWQKIAEDINASASTTRTKEEVEKKWKNMKAASKKSYSTFSSQTAASGGGPPPAPLSPVTDAVIEVVGRDNVTLTGIPDGCDSTLIQLHCMDDTSDSFRPTLTRTLSYPATATATATATVSTPLTASATAAETSHSLELELLLKEKIELEIECLQLKRKYYKMKISNIEE